MGWTIPIDRCPQIPFIGANPGAGNAYNLIPPTQAVYRVVGGRFILTTSVAVANRAVRFDYFDGANAYGGFVCGVAQAASLAYEYIFMMGYTGAGSLQGTIMSLPWADNIWIDPFHYLRISVVNMQAADTITGILFTLEQSVSELP